MGTGVPSLFDLKILLTPHSMNSLFSEFFWEFSGVILGVCETIWGSFWTCFGRILEEKTSEKLAKTEKNVEKHYFPYFLLFSTISLFWLQIVYSPSRV